MSFKLARVANRGLTSGEPLPDVYSSLRSRGIRFYRGGVTLIAGTPGSMKTMFILNMADELKIPTLYISNDSDEMTIISRMLSRRTQQDSDLMREKALRNPDWASRKLSDMDWIRWNFTANPTLEEIEEEIQAFEDLWGDYPHLVVVDVLMKVDYVEEGSGTDESIVRYLDHLARETGACIIIACHTTEALEGDPCPPRKAIMYKVDKIPVMALTTAFSDGMFFLAPVKNRNGFADPTGRSYVQFWIDPSIATLEEVE